MKKNLAALIPKLTRDDLVLIQWAMWKNQKDSKFWYGVTQNKEKLILVDTLPILSRLKDAKFDSRWSSRTQVLIRKLEGHLKG